MLKTRIEFRHSKPYLSVGGELYAPLAYTAYFEECGEFSDFIRHGYRIFFINVSFTTSPINSTTGFSPFLYGIYEDDEPNYAPFDTQVVQILAECPDALIFPRINISMPKWWTAQNPDETVATPNGGPRESFCSDRFLQDGAALLKDLVSHIRSAEYADRIAGYQLCGGATQEWFPHDLSGSYSEPALHKFCQWARMKYPQADLLSPKKEDFSSNVLTEAVSRYGEFCCETTAKAVEHFAKVLKEYIYNEQIVGVFYGYNCFVTDYLWGSHGLRHIIDSPYIDFFSSPCCYDHSRALGVDWGDMLPVDSLQLHKKLCFIECDIRTHLTRAMQFSRPGIYPEGIYTTEDDHGNKTVWAGPDTLALSISALRKAFAHQLTKGSGVWWFDMWGGWYRNDSIMSELETMRQIAETSISKTATCLPSAETVLFIDEKAYANNLRGSDLIDSVNRIRVAMGNTGIPFKQCMVEDAAEVLPHCRAAIFTAPLPSESGKAAIELCQQLQIPCLVSTKSKASFSTAELRAFLTANGIHCYNPDGCVVYCGNGYLGVHATFSGEIRISLPGQYTAKPLLGSNAFSQNNQVLNVTMQLHDTVLFELTN